MLHFYPEYHLLMHTNLVSLPYKNKIFLKETLMYSFVGLEGVAGPLWT